jgi:maleylpyruvate isomerase
MQLYSFFRSSAAFRVRIALELKGLGFETIPVHLRKDGGQQHSAEFRARNPDGLVPVLVDGDYVLNQSLAIIEYLDEAYPQPSLLPGDAAQRAHIRALALGIACEIHPLDNLRVLTYLKQELGVSDEQKDAWYRHWITIGFAALERRLAADPRTGRFCVGDSPTLADVCLVPQVFNSQRVNIDLNTYPTLARIFGECMQVEAVQRALPAAQPDAE